jgi:hypothetical protein
MAEYGSSNTTLELLMGLQQSSPAYSRDEQDSQKNLGILFNKSWFWFLF